MKLKLNYFALGELLNKDKFMEDLKIINGKVQLDDGSEIDFKPVFAPQIEYGDWNEDNSISIIRIDLDKEEFNLLTDKNLKFNELHFIDDQFWFDFDTFYLVVHNSDYLYNRVINAQFILVFFDNNENQFSTLNFSNN